VTASAPGLLAMSAITKRFPGVVALQDVSLTLAAGEVLGLMGENGAGKSTLMKILGGAQPPDEGRIVLGGHEVTLDSVRAAKRAGIALIHQELMLAPNLDIAANIFLGNEPGGGPSLRPLARAEMNRKARELLGRVGLALDPTTSVSRLTAGQMQMVEIAKALSLEARVIIMDEPTSSLGAGESQHLFGIIRKLQADGIGIIYISHRMEEVFLLCDRITVLRDGRYVGDLSRSEATPDAVVGMMVGRELSAQYFPEKSETPASESILKVEDLLVPGAPAGVSFEAFRGEILGFAGLVGAGRTELMEALFGANPALGGKITLCGEPYWPESSRDAIRRGVYLAPEDRKRHGLVLPMTVAQNTSLPGIAGGRWWRPLDRKAEQKLAEQETKRLRIKAHSIHQRVVNLSGGNQQKVVLGKWLAMQPKVLICDEPTRGIDVGAKAEIYRHLANLAAEGVTILMVSSDMEEVLGMSDRVVVMCERRIQGVLERKDLTQQRVARWMTGDVQVNRGAA
jgi:ribose transport system ATP-binding protein